MTISRKDLIRILGDDVVSQAVTMRKDDFEEMKWDHLSTLLHAYETLLHTPLFEARRSFLVGLPTHIQILLVCHVLETETEDKNPLMEP